MLFRSAITLAQLRKVKEQIERRCKAEGWRAWNPKENRLERRPLKPEQVTLYVVCDKVIKPATEAKKTSFVELVAFAPQPPKWFVSHWWGEPVFDFIACLEVHSEDHQYEERVMTQKVGEPWRREWTGEWKTLVGCAYWVCAYANNQWNVEGELSDDPAQSSFRKALELAEGTVSILDRGGVVFSRVWCCYEIYVSLDEMRGRLKYEAYTAHEHTLNKPNEERLAAGFTDGLAEGDIDPSGNPSTKSKSRREQHFPIELATHSFGTELQKAEASMPEDRNRILNTISGRAPAELLEPAPAAHAAYDGLNAKLRGRFGAATLVALLKAGESIDVCLELIKNSRINKLVLNFESVKDLPSFDEA